jgi:hypothetical protein
MRNRELVPWRCGRGHILGLVRATAHDGHQLILLRQAITEPTESLDVLGTISGLAIGLECSICGCQRTWQPDDNNRRPPAAQAARAMTTR